MSRRFLFQWSFDQLSYQPSTQMTPALIGKGLVFWLTFKKNRGHWRFREYIYIASVSILFFHHDDFFRTPIPISPPSFPPTHSVGPVNSDQSQLDLREARTESGSAGGICGVGSVGFFWMTRNRNTQKRSSLVETQNIGGLNIPTVLYIFFEVFLNMEYVKILRIHVDRCLYM